MTRRTTSEGDRILCIVLTLFVVGYGWSSAASIPQVSHEESKPDAWLIVQEKTGACRMSVPPDWKLETKWPGHVMAPEQTETTLIAGAKRAVAVMSDADQKALDVDKVFENSPEIWFYSSKPIAGNGGKPNLIVYHVNVIREEGTCIAQILVNQSHSQDEIRRIALTVRPTRDPKIKDFTSLSHIPDADRPQFGEHDGALPWADIDKSGSKGTLQNIHFRSDNGSTGNTESEIAG